MGVSTTLTGNATFRGKRIGPWPKPVRHMQPYMRATKPPRAMGAFHPSAAVEGCPQVPLRSRLASPSSQKRSCCSNTRNPNVEIARDTANLRRPCLASLVATPADHHGCVRGCGAGRCCEQLVGRQWNAQCMDHETGRLHTRAPLGSANPAGPYTSMLPVVQHNRQRKRGVHAANLLALPSGDLLCTWFAGMEGTNGVLVAVSTLRRDQWTWAEPRVAAYAVCAPPPRSFPLHVTVDLPSSRPYDAEGRLRQNNRVVGAAAAAALAAKPSAIPRQRHHRVAVHQPASVARAALCEHRRTLHPHCVCVCTISCPAGGWAPLIVLWCSRRWRTPATGVSTS